MISAYGVHGKDCSSNPVAFPASMEVGYSKCRKGMALLSATSFMEITAPPSWLLAEYTPSVEITAPPSWLLAEYAPSVEVKNYFKTAVIFQNNCQLPTANCQLPTKMSFRPSPTYAVLDWKIQYKYVRCLYEAVS